MMHAVEKFHLESLYTYTGMVLSILASFVCRIIGKLASIDRTIPVSIGISWEEPIEVGKIRMQLVMIH